MRLVLMLALLAGCPSKKEAPPPPAPSAPVASASAAPVDPIKAKLATPLHREPVKLGERAVVFTGTKELALGAWVVTPNAKSSDVVPIAEWPAGVKVLHTTLHDGDVLALVESVAFLDQPAGLRGVVRISPGPMVASGIEEAVRFQGIKELKDVQAVLKKKPTPVEDADKVLEAASKSSAALGRALPKDGAEIFDVWQATFTRSRGKLMPGDKADHLLDLVRAAGSGTCDPACDARVGSDLLGAVTLEGKNVQKIFVAPKTAGAPSGTPREVASRKAERTTEILASRVNKVIEVLGEAPLTTSGGSIGVAKVELQEPPNTFPAVATHLALAIEEAGVSRVLRLEGAASDEIQVRFADLDGDGVTDLMLGNKEKERKLAFRAYLTPRTADALVFAPVDEGSLLALVDAPSIDEAVKRAMAVPAKGTTAAEACKLARAAKGSFPKGATVFTYDVPGAFWVTGSATVEPPPISPDHTGELGEGCPALACAPSRPVCSYSSGPATTYYWFAWEGTKMRLAGVALYVGT
jgi:hypothetical protein